VTQPTAATLEGVAAGGRGQTRSPERKGKIMPETTSASTVSVKDIKTTLGYGTLKEFSADWRLLDDTSKSQIRGGIADGTLTY